MTRRQRSAVEGMLFTDQYQLTMAQLYFRMGMHDRPAQFEHFARSAPDYGNHQAGYMVNAGMGWLLDWMSDARFGAPELDALRGQRTSAGTPMFSEDFLAWLEVNGSFDALSISAIPEGRIVHANVPLTVVRGPLAMAQILETALLNQLNFQTLIATKASRVVEAARGRPVLEFGLRRAPERGGAAASRAALIGGAVASSNVGLSHAVGRAPGGTHAHSMVQAFMALGEGELAAFRAYAEVYPDDCLLLVDTIDTLESGVPNAITVFDELAARGHRPVGIRLDSGDLAYLAIQAARLLDAAGFDDTRIVLSSGLDEILILQILTQISDEAGAYGIDADCLIARLTFGVGSKMSTSFGRPYLDGVYKLVAVENDGEWAPAIKLSETPEKTQNPGDKDVYRVYDERGLATADLIAVAGEELPHGRPLTLRHPIEATTSRLVDVDERSEIEAMLVPLLSDGHRLVESEPIDVAAQRRVDDLGRLDPGVRRLVNPHRYHVSVTPGLWDLKQDLIAAARRGS